MRSRRVSRKHYGEISLRQSPRGGGVRELTMYAVAELRRARAATLYIHGFNVDEEAARTCYANFSEANDEKLPEGTFYVFWPGDASDNFLLSVAAYPINPDRAVRCAQILADALTEGGDALPITKTINIIAHSLGCRLALELSERLSRNNAYRINVMVLMAPAVPVYLVISGSALDLHKYAGKKVLIFRSVYDAVLTYAFRIGQRFESSGPKNFFFGRGALGRLGLGGRNKHPETIKEIATNLDHGGYWNDRAVAKQAYRALSGERRRPRGRSLDKRIASGRTSPTGRILD